MLIADPLFKRVPLCTRQRGGSGRYVINDINNLSAHAPFPPCAKFSPAGVVCPPKSRRTGKRLKSSVCNTTVGGASLPGPRCPTGSITPPGRGLHLGRSDVRISRQGRAAASPHLCRSGPTVQPRPRRSGSRRGTQRPPPLPPPRSSCRRSSPWCPPWPPTTWTPSRPRCRSPWGWLAPLQAAGRGCWPAGGGGVVFLNRFVVLCWV